MPKISKDLAQRMRSEIEELYDDAIYSFKAKRAQSTIENAAFHRGLQYTIRSKNKSVTNDAMDARGEQAEIVNFTRTLINAATAATISELPNPEIPSAKGDERSKGRAKMSELLAKSFIRNNIINYEEVYRTVSWAKQVGLGWLKVCWDPDAGRTLDQPDGFDGFIENAPDPMRAPDDVTDDGFGQMVQRLVYEGEISTQFVPSVDGLPDPAARCRREMHYFFHRKLRPIRELANLYPTDFFGEPSSKGWDVGRWALEQQSYRALSDDYNSSFGGVEQNVRSRQNVFAEIVEFWEMPTRKFPRGRLVVFSGRMVIYMGPIPYKRPRIPFVAYYGDNIVASSFYPDGLVEDIKWLQRVANSVESKKLEIIKKMANPHLLVPHGSSIDKNTWGDIPGQVIGYTKGYRPEILQPAEVPQSMFAHTNDQFERAKFMSGYTDIDAGNVPSDTSGRMGAFAMEAAGKQRKPVMNLHVLSMVEVMQQCLYLAWEFYDDGRIVRMTGDSGPELFEFHQEDYDTKNDLQIDLFSGAPTSHAGRFAQTLEMMDGGLFSNTDEAQRARRVLGADYINKSWWDPFQEDRDRAKREQLQVSQNPYAMLSIKTYDVHKVHLEEHNRWRKTLEYEQLHPDQQASFDEHCELHEILMNASSLAQAGLQLPSGDTDPGGAPQQPMAIGPGPNAAPAQQPSPVDGGHKGYPGPPQTVEQFNQNSDKQNRSADQK